MVVQATDSQPYCLRRKGGRSLIEHPPVFSPDGRSLLVICESTVRVYNIQTAECSHVLEAEAGVGELVSVGFPADQPHNLYGCSRRGVVTVWTWQQGRAVLRETSLQIAPDSEILSFDLLDSNECFVTTHDNREDIQLAKYCLKSGNKLCDYNANIKYSKIWQVAIGWRDEHRIAAICDGSDRLLVCDLSKPLRSCIEITNLNNIRIICVAAHPTENCVVAGDALGRATLLKGDLFNDTRVVREVLHWHSLPLITAAFSSQGGYLLTGGLERVAVKWHLGSLAGSRQHKDVLPRLPGVIRHLALTASHIAIATNSNSIVITTPQLGLVSTIMECGGLSSESRLSAGLAYHRSLGALLLGGRTGHLQLFSTASDKLLYNVDITGFNKIPATRLNPNPVDTEVTCAAASADGQWLVTSEYRSDGANYPEERLKFWAFRSDGYSPFTLNTCVNLSHGGCRVLSIAINKTSDFCVTAGTDQKFRIWKREASVHDHKKKISWSCLTACYYASGVGASLDSAVPTNVVIEKLEDDFSATYLRKNKDDFISEVLGVSSNKMKNQNDVGSMRTKEAMESELEMGGVAISQDGSLIAAWFGSKLTLWDSHTCSLRSTLSHPSLRPKGVHVCFGNDDAAHYVVCTTEDCLAVWSLLSLSVRWLVHARPVALAPDPFSNRIAVVTHNNDVFVFTPHQSTPLLSMRSVLEARSGVLRECTFAPSDRQDIRLYLMRNDSEIYCLERESSPTAPLEGVSRVVLPVSNFGALLAAQQTSEVRREDVLTAPAASLAASPLSMLSASAHMVPSVSSLCTSFLQLLSGAVLRAPDASDEVHLVSDESSAEDEPESGGSRPNIKKVEFWKANYKVTKEKKVKKILTQPSLDLELVKSLLE